MMESALQTANDSIALSYIVTESMISAEQPAVLEAIGRSARSKKTVWRRNDKRWRFAAESFPEQVFPFPQKSRAHACFGELWAHCLPSR